MLVNECTYFDIVPLPNDYSCWSNNADVRLRPHMTALRVVTLQKVVEMQKKKCKHNKLQILVNTKVA